MAKENKKPARFFFGHHKCATGWIDSILREACFHLGWRFGIVHHGSDIAPYGSLLSYYERRQTDLLAFTNAEADLVVAGGAGLLGFHVVRDPRDVVVSGYFSHRYSHPTDRWPELVAHRKQLNECSKEEGLLLELEFSEQFLDPMARWQYDSKNILELRLEDISASPLDQFMKILIHLKLIDDRDEIRRVSWSDRLQMKANVLNQRGRRFTPFHLPLCPVRFPMERLPTAILPRIIEGKSFSKMSGGRSRGQENVKSHYRKGTPGDWRNHFSDENIRAFKSRYNGLLLELGYEQYEDWT